MVGTRRHVGVLSLKTLRAALILAIPLSVVGFYRTRLTPPSAQLSETTVLPEAPVPNSISASLDAYAPLWQRDLKQPPIPAALTTLPPKPTQESMPSLLATFVAPNGRYAHFSDGNGRVEFKTAEEQIGCYRVAVIEPGRVRLTNATQDMWLEVPRPKEP